MLPAVRPASLAALAILACPCFLGGSPARATEPVRVENFPRVQEVTGTVSIRNEARVTGRTDATRFLAFENRDVPPLVGSRSPRDYQLLGSIEADGYASAILSLAAWLPAGVGQSGELGLLLVPDVAIARETLERDGQAPLSLQLKVPLGRATAGTTVGASSERLLLPFPRWRAYLYNTGTSALRVHAFVMLGD